MCDIQRTARCQCGRVVLEATGRPILTAICYCDDCQAGGRQLEALPGAPRTLEDDGGASYLTYRDDRFRCLAGEAFVKGYKLRERSATTRFVADCCNTPIYLKYRRGHWVSVFRTRFEGPDLPPVEMCTNLRYRQARTEMASDAPGYRGFPLRLFGRLIASRIDMALGR